MPVEQKNGQFSGHHREKTKMARMKENRGNET
jgi:hypothetical protein